MFAKVYSASVIGVNAHEVEVEVNTAAGKTAMVVVGLPDVAVKESRDRVITAVANSGYRWPNGRTTINLAPADVMPITSRNENEHRIAGINIASQEWSGNAVFSSRNRRDGRANTQRIAGTKGGMNQPFVDAGVDRAPNLALAWIKTASCETDLHPFPHRARVACHRRPLGGPGRLG